MPWKENTQVSQICRVFNINLTSCVAPPEENALVWYSLLPSPGYKLFSINPYTGLITTTSYLDREQQHHYTLRGRTQTFPHMNTHYNSETQSDHKLCSEPHCYLKKGGGKKKETSPFQSQIVKTKFPDCFIVKAPPPRLAVINHSGMLRCPRE